MSKNTCTPSSLFGGYEHTLFLGCSVRGFTATAGWNQQTSQLTVDLVQDPCRVPAGGRAKVYYDATLTRKTTTAADPGPYIYGDSGILQGPIIGSPCYFRHGEFEYCGLLQTFEETNGSDGRPLYRAVLVDPRAILEGTQIIIGNYAGSVYNVHNLINVFGFMESFGTVCPERTVPALSDVVFGTPAGGYGGANVNDNGAQVYQVLTGLTLLTSAFPRFQNVFSPYGRIVGKGSKYGGYGQIRYDRTDFNIFNDFGNPSYLPNENYHDGYLAEYFIDLSSLPVPPSYWRVEGTYVSALELITQVCTDAGHDFYIELVPVFTGNQMITKIIKVRTVSRNLQPQLGRIAAFIGNSNGVEQNNKGLEARQEVTQSFLIGGKRAVVFQAEQDFNSDSDFSDDVIIPYFGLDATGEAIIPTQVNGRWRFTVDITSLNLTLETVLGSNSMELTEEELQAAQGGIDSWLGHIASLNTDSYQKFVAANGAFRGMFDPSAFLKILDDLAASLLQPKDFLSINAESAKIEDSPVLKDIDRLFAFVNMYATEYYGRRFMVRIPYTCKRLDTESGKIITSEVPATEGGYTRQATILDLPHPTVLTDFFGSDDGRVGSFLRFANASTLKVDNLDTNEYGIYNDALYIRAEIEPDLVFVDDTPRVIINIPQAVLKKDSESAHDQSMIEYTKSVNVMVNKLRSGQGANVKTAQGHAGGSSAFVPYQNQSQIPDGAAVPLQSNIHTYGPWYVSGPPGVTKVEEDGGLVPWEYGGEDVMNLAGASRVNEGVTYMQCGEYGSITVPGIPTIPLGAELGATFGSGGSHLIENRSILTNGYTNTHHTDGAQNYTYYSTSLDSWTGLYGPNITNINVSVSEGGARTQYDFKTYTPQPGRFSRGNAERMKTIGQRRLSAQKQFRLAQGKNATLAGKFAQAGANKLPDKRQIPKKSGQTGQTESPHEVLVGTVNSWKDGRNRVSVAAISMKDLATEVANGYSSKAIMSWDGLIRPISVGGSTFAGYQNGSGTRMYGAQPPISDGTTTYYKNPIGGTQLCPVFLPSGDFANQYNHPTKGHDFELLARGSTAPNSSMVLPIEGGGDWDYTASYRMFALRGPLIVTGWGYDLNGKPIPNAADVEADASGGNFVSTNLQDKFLTGFSEKPHTWPVGAVDLRWDRNRKVWTVPAGYNMIAVTGEFTNCEGTGCYVTDGVETLYKSDGTTFTGRTCGEDIFLEQPVCPSGKHALGHILYYHPGEDQYWKIKSQQPATMYFGKLGSAISVSGSVEIRNAAAINGVAMDSTAFIAWNDFEMTASANAKCVVAWDSSRSGFVIIQAVCG